MTLKKYLNDMAGTTDLEEQGAANALAKTSGLGLQGALNAFIGTNDVGVAECLNRMARNSSFGPAGAAQLAAASTLNLLTANQASVETDTTGFAVNTNCASVAKSSAVTAAHRSSFLAATSTAAGNMQWICGSTSNRAAVSPNTQYTATVWTRAATVSRSCFVEIFWFTANVAGFISSSPGTGTANTTTGWTKHTVTATSPGTAAFAGVYTTAQSTGAGGEVHYGDKYGLFAGSSSVWVP